MENIFGRNWQEAKDPRNIGAVLGPVAFDRLLRDVDGLDNNDPHYVEQIADLVVKAWGQHILLVDFMEDLRNDPDIQNTFYFDLKSLVMMEFLYDQTCDKRKFPNSTKYTRAFKSKFTYRSKQQEIEKKIGKLKSSPGDGSKPEPRFLSGFFPNNPRPRRFNNLVDIGLVMALFASSDPKKNPYIPHDGIYWFQPFAFLQCFKTAFLKKEQVTRLLRYWGSPDAAPDKKILETEQMLSESICEEGYAAINQFAIERLTNMNFLIALYNLLDASGGENQNLPNKQMNTWFNCWITVPLFKTRLEILKKQMAGQVFSENIVSAVPDFLANNSIPFVYGTFCHVMNRAHASIGKDEAFFKKLYADPDAVDYAGDQYVLFQYNKYGEICPTERFRITGKNELSGVLFDLVKREKSVSLKHSLKKSGSFLDNYKILLQEYRSEIDIPGNAEKIRAKAAECAAIQRNLHATREEFWRTSKLAYLSGYKQASDQLKAAIGSYSEQYKNAVHEIREFMSPTAAFILDVFQRFGIPHIPGTLMMENPDASPFYETGLDDLQKHPQLGSGFGEFYKNMIRFFDESSTKQADLRFAYALHVLVDRYNDFDNVIRKIETLREFAVLNPDIVKALANVYNAYAPKKE